MMTNQSAFYTVVQATDQAMDQGIEKAASVRTGPESSPLVRSGPRFIAYHFLANFGCVIISGLSLNLTFYVRRQNGTLKSHGS